MDGEIFSFLIHQIEVKRLAYREARQAGADAIRLALDAYAEAMLRLNRYLLDGTIPEDVRDKLGK